MSSNKESAVAFMQLITSGRIREGYAQYVSPEMRHHNAYFPGDAKSLEEAMEANHAQFPIKQLDIKNVIADDDMVALHSHVRLKPEEPGMAACHIFRFANGKIVEMWDIVQPVPENLPNENGMF